MAVLPRFRASRTKAWMRAVGEEIAKYAIPFFSILPQHFPPFPPQRSTWFSRISNFCSSKTTLSRYLRCSTNLNANMNDLSKRFSSSLVFFFGSASRSSTRLTFYGCTPHRRRADSKWRSSLTAHINEGMWSIRSLV